MLLLLTSTQVAIYPACKTARNRRSQRSSLASCRYRGLKTFLDVNVFGSTLVCFALLAIHIACETETAHLPSQTLYLLGGTTIRHKYNKPQKTDFCFRSVTACFLFCAFPVPLLWYSRVLRMCSDGCMLSSACCGITWLARGFSTRSTHSFRVFSPPHSLFR